MSNFTIAQPNADLQSQVINSRQNPSANTTVFLDPSYTGQGNNINTFTTWDAAYTAIKDISGIREISFVPQSGSTTNAALFFDGATGTYDMTNVFISQATPQSMIVNVTAGFSLNNLLGIYAHVMIINMTSATQNFIVVPDPTPRTTSSFILQNVSVTGAIGAGIYFVYTVGTGAYSRLYIYLLGDYGNTLIAPASGVVFRAEGGVDLWIEVDPQSTFLTASSVSTDTGDLQMNGACSVGIPSLAAAYANVGGTVTFNNTIPLLRLTTANPAVTDDGNSATGSYQMGSIWVNTTAKTVFICNDNSDGAAVWTQIAP